MKEKCITTGMGCCLFFYFSLSFQMFRKQELSWENSGLSFGHHQDLLKTTEIVGQLKIVKMFCTDV